MPLAKAFPIAGDGPKCNVPRNVPCSVVCIVVYTDSAVCNVRVIFAKIVLRAVLRAHEYLEELDLLLQLGHLLWPQHISGHNT